MISSTETPKCKKYVTDVTGALNRAHILLTLLELRQSQGEVRLRGCMDLDWMRILTEVTIYRV